MLELLRPYVDEWWFPFACAWATVLVVVLIVSFFMLAPRVVVSIAIGAGVIGTGHILAMAIREEIHWKDMDR